MKERSNKNEFLSSFANKGNDKVKRAATDTSSVVGNGDKVTVENGEMEVERDDVIGGRDDKC